MNVTVSACKSPKSPDGYCYFVPTHVNKKTVGRCKYCGKGPKSIRVVKVEQL